MAMDADPDTTTAVLVAELQASFQNLHDVLKHFVGTLKRLERHAAAVAAQPSECVVRIHSPPPVDAEGRPVKRKPGRPKGARTRTVHIRGARSAEEARCLALQQ
jgi:hypothetical protein